MSTERKVFLLYTTGYMLTAFCASCPQPEGTDRFHAEKLTRPLVAQAVNHISR